MNPISSFFFRSGVRCALTLIALGVALCAVQQGITRYHPSAAVAPVAPPAPQQEARALPNPVAGAELPQEETPVAAAPKERSAVLADANVGAPVTQPPGSSPAMGAAVVSTVPGQAIAPPLAHAVPIGRSPALVGLSSSGATRLDPPLAFTVDPKNLTTQQQTELAAIQNQFWTAVGDPPNQNPDDPAYAGRWMTAQYLADQKYRAYFGWSAFEQMQVQRGMNSYGEIQ